MFFKTRSIFIIFIIFLSHLFIFSEKIDFTINQIDSSEYPVITAYLSVLDSDDNPVQGIKAEQFEVFENNNPVKKFEAVPVYAGGFGMSVVLAIDTSSSMSGTPLEESRQAALTFIERMGEFDEAAVITFDDDVNIIQPFTKNKVDLADSIESIIELGEYTALYDGIYDSISEFAGIESGRKALIVLTDGEDTKSNLTIDDCIAFGKEQNIPVYTIGFGANVKMRPLVRLSKLTGGRDLFTPEPSSLLNVYINISEQLKNQYALRYESGISVPKAEESELLIKLTYNGIEKQYRRSFEIPFDYTVSREGEYSFINFDSFTIVITICVGSLVLILLLVLIIRGVKKGKKKKKICPECGNEMKDDWIECLFCISKGKDPDNVENIKSSLKENKTGKIKSIQPSINTDEKGKTVRLNLKQQELAYLIIKDGSRAGKQYQLSQETTTIGRSSENDIVLDDESLSRDHAKIRLENKRFFIRDLATTNGTFVNNEKIVDKELKDDDIVKIGNITFSFKQVSEKNSKDESLKTETQIRNNKTILE